tara:strand:+ start:175 stop:546 length:372 start_codon:yes stop_codon:yes gene_type:complete
MKNHKLISKYGAGIAVVCIMFLPVVGCGGDNLNGFEILKHKDIWVEVKIFIALSIVSGIAILFMKHYAKMTIGAIAGLVSLLLAYFIAHSKNEGFELKIGGSLGAISYAVSAVAAYFGYKQGE